LRATGGNFCDEKSEMTVKHRLYCRKISCRKKTCRKIIFVLFSRVAGPCIYERSNSALQHEVSIKVDALPGYRHDLPGYRHDLPE